MISRSGVPSRTSYTPGSRTWPHSDTSVVSPARYDAGAATAAGTRASVSTFCTSVGRPQKPTAAGSGGLGRGQGRRPSSDSSSAVSSPVM